MNEDAEVQMIEVEAPPRRALFAALVKAMAEMGGTVAKDSTNPHFKNKYTSLGALREFTAPVLAKHGLALLHELLPPPEGQTKAGVQILTRIIHESGEEMTLGPMYIPCTEFSAQAVMGATTYGMRYCEIAALHLGSVDDDDGNTAAGGKPGPARSAIVGGSK